MSPTKAIGSVRSFFQHAFALPGSGSPGPSITPPPTAPPATLPSSKPTKKTGQQSFFSGAAMAQQSGMGPNQGKTLIGQ